MAANHRVVILVNEPGDDQTYLGCYDCHSHAIAILDDEGGHVHIRRDRTDLNKSVIDLEMLGVGLKQLALDNGPEEGSRGEYTIEVYVTDYRTGAQKGFIGNRFVFAAVVGEGEEQELRCKSFCATHDEILALSDVLIPEHKKPTASKQEEEHE